MDQVYSTGGEKEPTAKSRSSYTIWVCVCTW